jgi:hypothetical protein
VAERAGGPFYKSEIKNRYVAYKGSWQPHPRDKARGRNEGSLRLLLGVRHEGIVGGLYGARGIHKTEGIHHTVTPAEPEHRGGMNRSLCSSQSVKRPLWEVCLHGHVIGTNFRDPQRNV